VVEDGRPAHQLRVCRTESRRPCRGTTGCPGPPQSRTPRYWVGVRLRVISIGSWSRRVGRSSATMKAVHSTPLMGGDDCFSNLQGVVEALSRAASSSACECTPNFR